MKIYVCPICEEEFSAKKWNEKTQKVLQDTEGIIHIENARGKDYLDFVCPGCNSHLRVTLIVEKM